jgi:hypothetical protein
LSGKEYDAARDELVDQETMGNRIEASQYADAADKAMQFYLKNPQMHPSRLPPQLQRQLGQKGMEHFLMLRDHNRAAAQSAYNFNKAREAASNSEADAALLLDMQLDPSRYIGPNIDPRKVVTQFKTPSGAQIYLDYVNGKKDIKKQAAHEAASPAGIHERLLGTRLASTKITAGGKITPSDVKGATVLGDASLNISQALSKKKEPNENDINVAVQSELSEWDRTFEMVTNRSGGSLDIDDYLEGVESAYGDIGDHEEYLKNHPTENGRAEAYLGTRAEKAPIEVRVAITHALVNGEPRVARHVANLVWD